MWFGVGLRGWSLIAISFVFRGTRPIAFIDFDMIAPGERLEDLGYMAWSWCISSKASRQPIETQAWQIGILAYEYGIDEVDRQNLVERTHRGSTSRSIA